MIKNPKTVAFRVTVEEHEAITAEIGRTIGLDQNGPIKAKTVNDVLRYWLALNLEGSVNDLRKTKKQQEAKAKRKAKKLQEAKAKRQAKKAAAQ